MSDFDIILGMNWLTKHRAAIDCVTKHVTFGDFNNSKFIYHGSWRDLMNHVFHEYLDRLIIMFIYDILVYSNTRKEHKDHVHIVLEILRQKKLYAKFSKCDFWLGQVAFLGHIVSADSITMDPSKVEVITKWPRLTTVTEVRSFLEIAEYYRRFLEVFSLLVLPLTKLL
nr:putative reverse transcriptase domain-containing protein [Tanacetum cinerariifolium]